ncbi:MAG: hypothetical protein QNJ69_13560 [Gammaproteobacteria bacterium]|nr:hypothetical protein [Gammaproteobacteria bacterium]
MNEARNKENFSAWHPGIESEIPPAYRELETIYHPDNVFTSLNEINQLVGDTGLSAMELISFRPERLVLHELIVRITADIVVLEGETEEDLGINFRAITRRIYDHYVQPKLQEIEQSHESVCQRIEQQMLAELEVVIQRLSPEQAPPPTLWQRLTGSKPKPATPLQTREEREFALINQYKTRATETSDEFAAAVFRSLHRVLGSITQTRGFIGNDPQYLGHICVLHVCNYLTSRLIGRQLAQLVEQAIAAEGYDRIPDAQSPVLFSLKGASASGKSWLRPMLRSKLAKLGIDNNAYGTISPDIWRKLLLDYQTLGESYKYAGRFTSHEVSVIDAKLDRYIRDKARQSHSIPHLVVDRFRFDSFASEKIARVLHKTYVQYIDTMYMYFIVTPPEATVERGWQRGLERGRYKSVEDYLGHCVEAYAGMPKLLFKWLAYDKPRYSFKFYDNSVAKGSLPKLIARGTQGWMQLFEPTRFIDIERYQRIDIRATSPAQVAAAAEELAVADNLGFLRQCIQRIDSIEFVDAETDLPYLSIQSGKFEISDQQVFAQKLDDDSMQQIITELAPDLLPGSS